MLLIGLDKLRYKQLNTELKNNYIMGMDGYPQDLPGFIKLLNSYIVESGNNGYFSKILLPISYT